MNIVTGYDMQYTLQQRLAPEAPDESALYGPMENRMVTRLKVDSVLAGGGMRSGDVFFLVTNVQREIIAISSSKQLEFESTNQSINQSINQTVHLYSAPLTKASGRACHE